MEIMTQRTKRINLFFIIMGINNLNNLIKKHPIKKATVKNLIIDGSNVVITFIQSILKTTRENTVGGTIIDIFNFIVYFNSFHKSD